MWLSIAILPAAIIGKESNIFSHGLVEDGIKIDDRVTLKTGVKVVEGSIIGDDVSIGPNSVFSNETHPRFKQYPDKCLYVHIEKDSSIGSMLVF